MRKITLLVAALVALTAFAPHAALAGGGEEAFVGASGFVTPDGEMHVFGTLVVFAGNAQAATSSCYDTYCARFKSGRRDRRVTVTGMDDETAEVLFAVGQDRNGDGDAIDAGEYSVHCGVGSVAVRPKKNVDIFVLYGALEVSGGVCVSAPVAGTITANFSR